VQDENSIWYYNEKFSLLTMKVLIVRSACNETLMTQRQEETLHHNGFVKTIANSVVINNYCLKNIGCDTLHIISFLISKIGNYLDILKQRI